LGAGHVAGTPLPGDPGNSGIAGHRDTFFRGLKDVREDDEIQLQTATALTHYRVEWVKIVEPNDSAVLESSTKDSTLTLVTCYPFYFVGPAPKRFVVHARKK
jgi:sortase A